MNCCRRRPQRRLACTARLSWRARTSGLAAILCGEALGCRTSPSHTRSSTSANADRLEGNGVWLVSEGNSDTPSKADLSKTKTLMDLTAEVKAIRRLVTALDNRAATSFEIIEKL